MFFHRKTDIFFYKENEEKIRNIYQKLISVRSGFFCKQCEINYARFFFCFFFLLFFSFIDVLANLVHTSMLWPLEGLALLQHRNIMTFSLYKVKVFNTVTLCSGHLAYFLQYFHQEIDGCMCNKCIEFRIRRTIRIFV